MQPAESSSTKTDEERVSSVDMQSRKKELEKKLNQTGFLKGNQVTHYRSTSPGLWVSPPDPPVARAVDTSPVLPCYPPAAVSNHGVPAPPPPPPLAGHEMIQRSDFMFNTRGKYLCSILGFLRVLDQCFPFDKLLC